MKGRKKQHGDKKKILVNNQSISNEEQKIINNEILQQLEILADIIIDVVLEKSKK
jgi:hypothetical protein